MKAMLMKRLESVRENPTPLELAEVPEPEPGEGEALLRVSACAVCHTELDEIEGRTPPPRLPVIPGHQVVGRVVRSAGRLKAGDRVGVAWIYSACGACAYCQAGQENLCANFSATGRDANGGYAEYMIVPEAFTYPIPAAFSDAEAAPLLCAGAVGYRSLRLAGLQDGQRLGLTGFGASAHLVLQAARRLYPNSPVFVFSRSEGEQAFARELGAAWAGDTGASAPQPLNAIIDTTPVWQPVVEALRNLAPGGRLVINAIRKEEGGQVLPVGAGLPGPPVAGKRDQERRQRHPARRARVPRAGSGNPHPAGGPALPAGRCQPGAGGAEDAQDPGGQGFNTLIFLF